MAKEKKPTKDICINKNAARNYHLMDRFEAGVVLQGTEVKSLREGNVQLNDAYGDIKDFEVYLYNVSISPYAQGNRFNHEPKRKRKLLLHRQEIRKLIGAVVEKGFTLVPTRLYWNKGRVKVELALARGKAKGDKREDVKQKTARREMDRALKHSQSKRRR